MTDLENQMKFNMELRGYSPKTIKHYLICVSNFAKHYNKSLQLLGESEIQNYLHYCITEKRLGEGTVNYYHSTLKFFYTKILDREWKTEKLTRIKEGRKLPVILSQSEVKAIFEASKDKAGITKAATVHTLRHSFATHLLDAGTDICYIQRLLGHTSIQTTTIYLHLRRMDLINIKSPLDSL